MPSALSGRSIGAGSGQVTDDLHGAARRPPGGGDGRGRGPAYLLGRGQGLAEVLVDGGFPSVEAMERASGSRVDEEAREGD